MIRREQKAVRPKGLRRRRAVCGVAAPRRCAPASPASRRLASSPTALATPPHTLSPRAASVVAEFERIQSKVVACRRCPRLVAWREEAARVRPRRFREETYWARPLPAFGDPEGPLLIVGLAPAAHGGNRTGRLFTGDESGNFLFRALHAVGLANQPLSVRPGDGLILSGALLTAACRCAPPDNRPLPVEFENCREYLERELDLRPTGRVVVALGALAFERCLKALARSTQLPRPRPRFSHGASHRIGPHSLFAVYHPSQQNTFTGKLTQPMLRVVLRRAARAAARIPRTGDARTAPKRSP